MRDLIILESLKAYRAELERDKIVGNDILSWDEVVDTIADLDNLITEYEGKVNEHN